MKAAKAKDYIKNWQGCDIAQLVNHFHFFSKKANGDVQQERVKSMVFEGKVLKSDSITSLTLHMALKGKRSANGKLTFAPILEVSKTDDEVTYLEASRLMDSDDVYADLVPYAFKEVVSRNWLLKNSSDIDDLFLAYQPNPKGDKPQLQRLLRYHINGDTNALLFEVVKMDGVRKKLKEIILHLGADMNKASDQNEFTFTPVIELKTKKLSEETLLAIARLGLRSSGTITTDDDDGILFEYLKPCPATCN
ncbi:MAG: hypothetical protein Roseis2KO_03730 [Roseivirga sp.]